MSGNQKQMHFKQLPFRLLIPGVLLTAGVLSVALALGADLLGIGGGQFGTKQTALLVLGCLSLLGGLTLAMPAGWQRASAWRRQLRASTAAASVLLMAAWFGLLAGWGQVVVLFARKEFQGEMLGMGIDYGWMTPAANLASFLVVGLALHLIHKQWPHFLPMRTAIFLLAWLALFGLALMIRRISVLALAVLAAGVALQFSRIAIKHWRGYSTLVRFSVGWPALLRKPLGSVPGQESSTGASTVPSPTRREFLIGAASGMAVVALGTRATLAYSERRTVTTAFRPTTQTPNVLLIVLDTVRAQSLSLYGYERPTSPKLALLAKQGIVFERAIATAPWTLPSHASMFTGRLPGEFSYGWLEPVVTEHPFLAEMLSKNGFATAGFVANKDYCAREYGLARGFAHYEDYRTIPEQAFLYTSFGNLAQDKLHLVEHYGTNENFGRKSAEQVNRDFTQWLRRSNQQPFFGFLNYYDAHDPFLPPPEFSQAFASETLRGFITPELARQLNPKRLRELQDAYDASISYLDFHIGELIDNLSKNVDFANTLVIITSDHGEQFGEHNLLSHGNSLYRFLVHVPLVILWPGKIPAGRVVTTPVSLRDVPATVMELADLRDGAHFPGKSLSRFWREGVVDADQVPAAYSEVDISWDMLEVPVVKGKYRSLVTNDYHYIAAPDGREEIYDFAADPSEMLNLAATHAGRQAIVRLRELLPHS